MADTLPFGYIVIQEDSSGSEAGSPQATASIATLRPIPSPPALTGPQIDLNGADFFDNQIYVHQGAAQEARLQALRLPQVARDHALTAGEAGEAAALVGLSQPDTLWRHGGEGNGWAEEIAEQADGFAGLLARWTHASPIASPVGERVGPRSDAEKVEIYNAHGMGLSMAQGAQAALQQIHGVTRDPDTLQLLAAGEIWLRTFHRAGHTQPGELADLLGTHQAAVDAQLAQMTPRPA